MSLLLTYGINRFSHDLAQYCCLLVHVCQITCTNYTPKNCDCGEMGILFSHTVKGHNYSPFSKWLPLKWKRSAKFEMSLQYYL